MINETVFLTLLTMAGVALIFGLLGLFEPMILRWLEKRDRRR